jgi:hypothetical protein
MFQQQRLALEAAGVRPWLDAHTYVPICDTHIPPLDWRDPSHPRIYHRIEDNLLGTPTEYKRRGNRDDMDPNCVVE